MGKVLLGKYELREKIGEGASGIVYLAWDRHLECVVAVKEQKLRQGEQDSEALKKEREMLKALKHPMLPAVYDYFVEGAQYLVMEYVEGMCLHNFIEKEGSIPERQACEWAIQLAGLLLYLHTRKPPVIYRDLKPDNIIVCPDGNLRVVDFGTALSISYDRHYPSHFAGTIGYAAPEQLGAGRAAGARADERSDIYTLGATLYHMLTGHHPSLPPYGVRTLRSMKPELSHGIERIVKKCTQTESDKRYQNIEEVKRDLLHREAFYRKGNCRQESYRDGSGKMWSGRRQKDAVIRKIEKKIWLTEKKTIGLFALLFLLFGNFGPGGLCALVKGREKALPVIVYNEQGQKVIIRYDSVYQPDGNMLLELGHELFEEEGVWELSVALTGRENGKRQERVFYIRGGG